MPSGRKSPPKLGQVIELSLPGFVLAELGDLLDDWRTPFLSSFRKLRRKRHAEVTRTERRIVRKLEQEERRRVAFAHVAAWERGSGQSLPPGHVVLFIDGDKSNIEFDNLYCLPRRELVGWMAFVRHPIEAYVYRMEEEIMSLDTSEAVKKELIRVLDQLVDPAQKPDIIRQRAICETVQTLVGLLRVEVAYIRAIEGDAVVPFLEDAHEEAVRRQAATKKALFRGNSPSHPWRGLGGRDGESR